MTFTCKPFTSRQQSSKFSLMNFDIPSSSNGRILVNIEFSDTTHASVFSFTFFRHIILNFSAEDVE